MFLSCDSFVKVVYKKVMELYKKKEVTDKGDKEEQRDYNTKQKSLERIVFGLVFEGYFSPFSWCNLNFWLGTKFPGFRIFCIA